MQKSYIRQSGFTIIDALVGSLLLAIGAVVACGITQHCSQNWQRCIQYETGYRVLDECFEQALLQGPAPMMQQEQSLQQEVVRPCANYRCEFDITETEQNNLYEVTATVTWQAQEAVHELTSTSLIYDPQQPSGTLEY